MSVRNLFHPHADGTFTLEAVQDVEPIIDNNKRLQNTPQRSDWGRHVASIPLVIWQKWTEETNGELDRMDKATLTAFLRKKLADPDYLWLRTA